MEELVIKKKKEVNPNSLANLRKNTKGRGKFGGKEKNTSVKIGRVDILDAVLAYTSPSVLNPNGKKLTLNQALSKVGVTYDTIRKWMREQPFLQEKWDSVMKLRRETMKMNAEKNVEEALAGDTKLKPRERVEISMRYLEKTSPEYQPKIQMEAKSINLHMDRSIEDLEEELKRYASQTVIINEDE